MTEPHNGDVRRSLDTLIYTHYLEQLVSDLLHILYDLALLSLLTERAVAEKALRLLRGRILNVPLGPVINEVLAAREKGKDLNIISPGNYGLRLYADTLFAREDLVKRRPEVVKNFVAATLEGWNYAVDHPDEAARATLTFDQGLQYEHELGMMKESIPAIKPDAQPLGTMNQSEWESMQTLLVQLGFMSHAIDVSKVFDSTFVTGYYAAKQK